MLKPQIVGSHLHSPEYFAFFAFLAFSQWFCMVIKWDLCFVCFSGFSQWVGPHLYSPVGSRGSGKSRLHWSIVRQSVLSGKN